MSLFFPDNDNRHARLIQLSTDTQNFLIDSKKAYQDFILLNSEVNDKIAAIYKKANISQPLTSSINILKIRENASNSSFINTIVEINNLLVDVDGFLATVYFFAPAATTMLLDTGIIEAETASSVLFSTLGCELTLGALAGVIIGGIVVGIVVASIEATLETWVGYELRDELRKGLLDMCQLRFLTKFAFDKSITLVTYLKSVKTTCDSLLESSIELTDEIIKSLIEINAIPALNALNAIDKHSVLRELSELDNSRISWKNEDMPDNSIELPHI